MTVFALGGCARSTLPTAIRASSEPPLPRRIFDRPAVTEVLARNAYVRVQAEAGAGARSLEWVPVLGDFVDNLSTHEVTTINFTEAFIAKSKAFLAGLCPDCGAGPPAERSPRFWIEVTLARASYSRTNRELRQSMTLRILGALGTVIYAKVATSRAHRDVIAEPALVDRVLNDGFARLAAALDTDMPRIMDNARCNEISQEDLAGLLLAHARELGQPSGSGTAGRSFAVLVGVREALTRWLVVNARPEDTVLVYFSGHGSYSESVSVGDRQEKYFYPVDFDETAEDPYGTAIPMEEIIDYFDRLAARNVVMIFDACNARAAAREGKADELTRFVQTKNSTRLNVIVAAAKAQQTSWEYGGEGLFTGQLTLALKGKTDANEDGTVTVGEAARFVAQRVREESVAKGLPLQEPVWSTNDEGRAAAVGLAAFARRGRPWPPVPARHLDAATDAMVAGQLAMKFGCQSCLLFLLGAVAWSGCAPAHYSVSVAQGPTHTTFARRNPKVGDDYLVDCKNDSDGRLYDCYVVKLPRN